MNLLILLRIYLLHRGVVVVTTITTPPEVQGVVRDDPRS